MGNYVYIYCAIAVLWIGLLAGCKSQKNISRTVDGQTRTERIESKKDTSRVEEQSQAHHSTQTNEQDNTYVRITEYDSTGTVIRRIQEEWRDVGRSQLSLLDRSGHYISIDGMSSVTLERDSSRSVVTENKEVTSDSRPVQGVEWLWVILGGALVLSVVIFVIIKKK